MRNKQQLRTRKKRSKKQNKRQAKLRPIHVNNKEKKETNLKYDKNNRKTITISLR